MNDVFKILYTICFFLAVVSFCTAGFIFFKFRIVDIIQDLNGTIAKHQIRLMRERNVNARNYGVRLLDTEFGKTCNTGRTGKIDSTEKSVSGYSDSYTTSSLQNQTTEIDSAQNGTMVLQSNRAINPNFIIIKNIVFINTSESI